MGTPVKLSQAKQGSPKMLTKTVLAGIRRAALLSAQRNFGASAVLSQKAATDTIQQLFLEKTREYAKKAQATGGQDFAKFPSFTYSDPTLEEVGVPPSDKVAVAEEGIQTETKEKREYYYWENVDE